MKTDHKHTLILFFLTAMSVVLMSCRDIELKEISQDDNVSDFFVADFDGDEDPEYLAYYSTSSFLPREIQIDKETGGRLFAGRGMFQMSFQPSHKITGLCPLDIDTAIGVEIAALIKDTALHTAWVEIYSGRENSELGFSRHNRLLCRTDPVIGKDTRNVGLPGYAGWDGFIERAFAVDLDGDSIKELIVSVQVGFDCIPRGIHVYDYPSGQLRWFFPSPGNIVSLFFADANGDAHIELYFKTYATGNGCEAHGLTDSIDYIFAVDSKGQLLWRENLDNAFDFGLSNIQVCDCDNDSVIELYYTKAIEPEDINTHKLSLQKRRAWDNKLLDHRILESDRSFNEIITGDLDGDQRSELIFNDRPSVYDARDFNMVSEGARPGARLVSVMNVDESQDGTSEIIAHFADTLVIYDRNFNIRGFYQAPEGSIITRAKAFRSPQHGQYVGVVTFQKEQASHTIHILQVCQFGFGNRLLTLISPKETSWPYVIVVFGLGSLVGLIAARLSLKRAAKSKVQGKEGDYDNLLTALITFQHGQTAAKNLNRLAFLLGNLPDTEERLAAIRPNILAAIEAFESFTAGQLQKINSFGHRVREAHKELVRLQQNTSKLAKTLSSVRSEPLTECSTDLVPNLVKEIKGDVKLIYTHVQSSFAVDLLSAARDVIAAVRHDLDEQGIILSSLVVLGDFSQPVFFARDDLAAVLEELISNASRSMVDQARKQLDLTFEYQSEEVVVGVADTGKGLGDTDPATLFDRQTSTKIEGGGYGLFFVRQQVQKFGGQATIENNPSGIGATVKLRLRIVSGV